MKTNLERTKENCFKIEKVGTKHRKDFKYNIITRPLTLNCALQMLTKYSDTTLSEFQNLSLNVRKWAKDYVNDNKSDARIELTSGKYAKLIFGKGLSKEKVRLNSTFFEDFDFLADEELYTTEF